jgi:ABC-2 type transport system ATP-binding protein
MEEAEKLCDRVGIIDYGKIITIDTPGNLLDNLSADSKVTFNVENTDIDTSTFEAIGAVSRVEKVDERFILYTKDENVTLQELVRLSDMQKFKLSNLRTESPNLDDVFLAVTGREMRE